MDNTHKEPTLASPGSTPRPRRRISTKKLAAFIGISAIPVAALGVAQTAEAGSGLYVNVCATPGEAFPGGAIRHPPHALANAAAASHNCSGAVSNGWVSAAIVVSGVHGYYTGSVLQRAALSLGNTDGRPTSYGCTHWGRNKAHHLTCTWVSS